MKKTKSATRSGSSKTSAPGAKTAASAHKPARIPVRGAKRPGADRDAKSMSGTMSGTKSGGKSGGRGRGKAGGRSSGVSDRAPLAPPTRAQRANLAEVRTLALAAIDAALDKKALAPVLIDVSSMASYTDFIGIVSGRSDRQVDAIAENIRVVMKQHGRMTLGQEGTGNGRWTLLDFGSIVIHVFFHPVREFYDLESLWIEAPRVPIDVPADSTLSEPESFYGAL